MTGRIKMFFNRVKTDKKKAAILLGIILVFIMVVSLIVIAWNGSNEEVVYKETQVIKGDLNVGVTESGSVTMSDGKLQSGVTAN